MKLTMTHRGRGETAVIAEGAAGRTPALHLDPRDGTLSLAVYGHGGHVYTLSASREDWQALFFRAEDLYDAQLRAEGGHGGPPPDQDTGVQVDGALGYSGFFTDPKAGDPTPVLTESVRQDMEASALDCLRKNKVCTLDQLAHLYSFTTHQVAVWGRDAIAAARAAWEKEGGHAA